ncbi:MAG: hydroxymethylglutaryl-CoA reductase, degradative [Flavobacteriaceae bacterium]|nr:hydroxymethylglutaryl-CoA reductase, degradative [Flavobacteriaceae bacterium]
MSKSISGFSKLSKQKKIEWIIDTYFPNNDDAAQIIKQYWNNDEILQKLHDEFIENTITNYYLPFGVAPNFLINGRLYAIPMAIEESSVVAAASKSAKFWLDRGGFKTKIISTTKIGQVHFLFNGAYEKLNSFFKSIKHKLIDDAKPITQNMDKRGGGILDIELRDKTQGLENYYQLHATFETLDAMGANFINSCLEQFASTLKHQAEDFEGFDDNEKNIQVIMSILSNYVPDCLVRAEVNCPVAELNEDKNLSATEFGTKFIQALKIAELDPHRAVTHNKGVMNGVDAVVLATGNDFRAIEAGVHAFAARNGNYTSLTHAKIENSMFSFWIELPMALGTVGGLTNLHPLVKLALEMLHHPTAKELMQIVAVAGLAQNFAAIRSLITTGIQEGHMKMHLMNILNQFHANEEERSAIVEHFKKNVVTHSAVVEAINDLRNKN